MKASQIQSQIQLLTKVMLVLLLMCISDSLAAPQEDHSQDKTIETLTPRELCRQARFYLSPKVGGVRNRKQAIIHLRQAVNKGDAKAASMLGRLLLDPFYSTYNKEEGEALLRTASKKGIRDNDFLLDLPFVSPARFTPGGTNVPFGNYYSKSANPTDFCLRISKDMFYGDELSLLYDYSEIRTFSLHKLQSLAAGNVTAGILWAYRVTQKLAPESDKETQRAIDYLRKASSNGYEMASLVLASHYGIVLLRKLEKGSARDFADVIPELKDRLHYFLHTYEQGLKESAGNTLGTAVRIFLATGEQPSLPDELIEEGVEYVKSRARETYDLSIVVAGYMHLWGIYVEQDEKEATRWFEMLALSGHKETCELLFMYYSGQYAPPGKERRESDFEKANYYKRLLHRYNMFVE